jgi:hypothetical protein
MDIPDDHGAAIGVVDDWDDMADLGYELSEAEVLDFLGRNAPSLITGVLTVDNEEFAELYQTPMLHEMYYSMMAIWFGRDERDEELRRKTLKKIVGDMGGGLLLDGFSPDKAPWAMRVMKKMYNRIGLSGIVKSLPGLLKLLWRDINEYGLKGADYMMNMLYEAMVRCGMNMRGSFKYGGSFHTSMGALTAWDVSVRSAKVGKQVKERFIERGLIFDDGADNAWGGLYEDGAYGHLEELAMYDPRDETCREGIREFVAETNVASIEQHCGDPINGVGPPNHVLYSPACMNYDQWQQKIKAALDPKDSSDASFYTDPEFAEDPPDEATEIIEKVMDDRDEIELD